MIDKKPLFIEENFRLAGLVMKLEEKLQAENFLPYCSKVASWQKLPSLNFYDVGLVDV